MNKNLLLLYIKKLFKPERFLSIVRHYRLYKKYNKHHISIGFDTQINDSKLGDYVWIGDKENKQGEKESGNYYGCCSIGACVSDVDFAELCCQINRKC